MSRFVAESQGPNRVASVQGDGKSTLMFIIKIIIIVFIRL